MPYKVVAVPGGYKVKKDVPGKVKYFSERPLSKTVATAQMKALYAAEKRKWGLKENGKWGLKELY